MSKPECKEFPAFPSQTKTPQGELNSPEPGMNLRDYFAAKAMPVIYAQCENFPDEHWRDGVARDAYMLADAMLRAREEV